MLYCRVCYLAELARAGVTCGSNSPGLNLAERDEALALLLEDLRERLRNGVPGASQDDIVTQPTKVER
jgi:hypothetical protein